LRSLLVVPADNAERLDKAFRAGADALVLDLADTVAADAKEAARRGALAALRRQQPDARPARLFVRINPLGSGLADGDLDVVMTGAPDGIVLPQAEGAADLALLDAKLALREALHALADGSTRIIAVLETPAAFLAADSVKGKTPRLGGLAWNDAPLAAALGIRAVGRRETAPPSALARSLALFAAAAAGVPAIDAPHADLRGTDGLREACADAVRDGFTAKLALQADQVETINAAFAAAPPTAAEPELALSDPAEAAPRPAPPVD
jgi:citrate lyase subunit beta/citryl-CoA lyase